MATWVFDTETLPNRTLFSAKCVDSGEYFDLWRHEPDAPARLLKFLKTPDSVFVSFNGRFFDNPVLAAFCAGRTEEEIKRIANDIIENNLQSWKTLRKYGLPEIVFDDIDLIEVAPSFVGLKAYGARMHMPVIQDMPIEHDTVITEEQEADILDYCHNDLDTTEELLKTLDTELMLRVEMSKSYGVDMRSKSDSQMAEQAYITSMGLKRKDNVVPKSITYKPPGFLKFEDEGLQELLERVSDHIFHMNPGSGHVILPHFLGKDTIKFGFGEYQLGVGGIHSVHDRKVCYVAGDGYEIEDIDAASFYPSIILECGFVPQALGVRFVDEYRKIYNQRLLAKKEGRKTVSESLKISLNGTFGKLASRWSVLYSPDLMLAVTLTGQFTLLMLIEWLEMAGAQTLSANTDGIAIRYRSEDRELIRKVVAKFSDVSRFVFEYTPYRILALKDVNNYIAVKPDRSVKAKGIYAPLSLRKNPTAQVCSDAVANWLARGTPFMETISNAPFKDFLSARNVTGGGCQGDKYLGKVVRWYQSNDETLPPLLYRKNGHKVPKTEGARECMRLPSRVQCPEDLDYQWYYREAVRIAADVGAAEFLTASELEIITPKPKPKKTKVKK